VSTSISFAGNSLQTSNIITTDIQHAGLPTKKAQYYALSHANASYLPFVEYPTKPITISGTLNSDNIADMDALIDTFNTYFTAQDQNLDIGYNGTTRRYICTATSMQITRPGGLAWANFSVGFTCSNPFGMDTSSTTLLSASGRTLGLYTDTETFGGTAPFQLPIITITLTAVSDAGGGYITYGNNTTGQVIAVNRTWANGDVLVIDCTQNTVTVNGVAVNFSGAFPQFAPGSQVLGYADSFASRTFTISVTYTKLYF
jgi:tail protein